MAAYRSVETAHYHLWTDVVHARQLARDSVDEWDRGTYVRWTIQSAWSAFESTCEDVLQTRDLGMRFKDRFDAALLAQKPGAPIDWGRGLWQQVLEVYQLRKDYTHPRVPQERLFAPLAEAEGAIETLRLAIRDLHTILGLQSPQWVEDDAAAGWKQRGGAGGFLNLTAIRAGARDDDPERVRVVYVYKGDEHESEVLPAGSDPRPAMEELLRRVIVPVSEVRAYRGESELVDSIKVKMRGS